MAVSPRSEQRRRVGVLVFDGVKMLDLAGPAEVFVEATDGDTGYELVFMSPDGADVLTSVGTKVTVGLPVAEGGRFDTVVVPGSDRPPATFVNNQLLDAVAVLSGATRRLVSICSGAFLLAELGLLDGCRAATHWKHTDELARKFPAIKVDPDSIWVRDGCVYSSAGVAAGIDLALALVEEDLGADAARRVAQTLLVYMRRPGGQSQFSASLRGPAPKTAVVSSVVDLIYSDPSRLHTVQELARFGNVSVRSLTRLFRTELRASPAEYVAFVRFGFARDMLDAGYSVTHAATEAGYGSGESMRRAFVDRLGISPRTYQRRFGHDRVAATRRLRDLWPDPWHCWPTVWGTDALRHPDLAGTPEQAGAPPSRKAPPWEPSRPPTAPRSSSRTGAQVSQSSSVTAGRCRRTTGTPR